VAAPSGVPAPIKETLAKAFNTAAAVQATRERLAQAGFDPVPAMTAAQLDDYIKRQVAFWHDLVKDSGAKAD
jgi:tripartite-type tricarboxylate transporter receptor subunit TctC